MIKHLVSFGDSWVYGTGLLEGETTFTGLIAKKYGLTYNTYSEPGSSQRSALWEFNSWLSSVTLEEAAQTLVIVGLTDSSRTSWHDVDGNGYVHSKQVQGGLLNNPNKEMWDDINKHHYALSYSEETRRLDAVTIIRSLEGIAHKYNIPLLMVKVFGGRPITGVTTVKQMKPLYRQIIDDRGLSAVADPDHPSQEGHIAIADLLDADVQELLND